MVNKGMLTNRYNRKLVNGKLCFTVNKSINNNDSSVDFKTNEHFTNPIESVSIKPDIPYTYKKPNHYAPSNYTDVLRSKHYVKKLGNRFFEIPKNEYRIPSIELKQFTTLVKTACKVFASLNGYITIKDIRNYLLEHDFQILDSSLLSDTVKAFLSDKPHLKKTNRHNSVKHNKTDYGFECDVHYHNSWYDREYWGKLFGICEL